MFEGKLRLKGKHMDERIEILVGQVLDKEFSETWTTMDYDDLLRFAEAFATALNADRLMNKSTSEYYELTPLHNEFDYNYSYSTCQVSEDSLPTSHTAAVSYPVSYDTKRVVSEAEMVLSLAEALRAVNQQLADEKAKNPVYYPSVLGDKNE